MSESIFAERTVQNLLDTDFYKLTMMQAVLHNYPNAEVEWEFRCRNSEDLTPYLAEKRSTGVIEFLRHNGVDRVLVGGLALDYCVKTTALQLRRAGFAVDVYLPACRAIAEDTANSACAEMRAAGIALHASLDELDAALNMDGDN